MTGLMRRLPRLRSLLLPLCLTASLAACSATSGDESSQSTDFREGTPENLPEMLSALRKNSRLREVAALFCSASLTETEDADYKPFMASFFGVSPDEAGLTLCRVLIEAVVSNELTEQDVEKIEDPQSNEDFVLFGAVLRKMLTAQERLNSQQVGRPPLIASGSDRSAGNTSLPRQK